jgi:2'-5' RNA ligase
VRLFVALIPPGNVLADLAAAITAARGPCPEEGPDLRWAGADHWHLTLTFLGQVDEDALAELMGRLARAARRHQPVELSVAGAGVFGARARARVLWAGIRGDRGQLKALAASVAAGARRSGIAVDDRPYRPHLTLARSRARQGADVRAIVEALESYAGPSWTARELHLVRSYLGRQGSRYETLRSWPLGALPRANSFPG